MSPAILISTDITIRVFVVGQKWLSSVRTGEGIEPLALCLELDRPCGPSDGWMSERSTVRGLLAASF